MYTIELPTWYIVVVGKALAWATYLPGDGRYLVACNDDAAVLMDTIDPYTHDGTHFVYAGEEAAAVLTATHLVFGFA